MNDDRDRVLQLYGEVMVLVQQWELALTLLWWKAARKQPNRPAGDFDTARSQTEIRRLQAAYLKQTANGVKAAVAPLLDEATIKDFDTLWAERNRLAHRFLRETEVDGTIFRPGTCKELLSLGDRFLEFTQAVKDKLLSYPEYSGPVLEGWRELAERLLDRLGRGEPIPDDPSKQ